MDIRFSSSEMHHGEDALTGSPLIEVLDPAPEYGLVEVEGRLDVGRDEDVVVEVKLSHVLSP